MIYLFLALLGVALGSFVNAFVWRLHEQSKTKSNKFKKELSITQGRSMCPECKHTLAWFDLIPVLSWISLAGKCRYCKKPISAQYPLVEVVVAALVPISWYSWPFLLSNIAAYLAFGVWIIVVVLLAALFLYDLKWMTLPNKLVYSLLGAATVFRLLECISTRPNLKGYLLSSILGMAALGGLFWVIYQVSNGEWIGGGDVRLGFGLGMLLGAPKALLCLTGAAYLATFVILIIALLGKYHKKMKLPFGPFLIAAAYMSFLWGQHAIDIYKRLSGS